MASPKPLLSLLPLAAGLLALLAPWIPLKTAVSLEVADIVLALVFLQYIQRQSLNMIKLDVPNDDSSEPPQYAKAA
jgi:hypothetical protein